MGQKIKIFLIRSKKVMLDSDLTLLYKEELESFPGRFYVPIK